MCCLEGIISREKQSKQEPYSYLRIKAALIILEVNQCKSVALIGDSVYRLSNFGPYTDKVNPHLTQS